jgi:hypothetical protein
MPTIPDRVVFTHRCHCPGATEPPGEAGVEHVFTIDGAEFPWYIAESGLKVTRLADDFYAIDLTVFANHVECVGVDVRDERPGPINTGKAEINPQWKITDA